MFWPRHHKNMSPDGNNVFLRRRTNKKKYQLVVQVFTYIVHVSLVMESLHYQSDTLNWLQTSKAEEGSGWLLWLRGAFNKYVDKILPNFDHLPPSSGQLIVDILQNAYHLFTGPRVVFKLTNYPPLLVHVVIEGGCDCDAWRGYNDLFFCPTHFRYESLLRKLIMKTLSDSTGQWEKRFSS